MTTNRPISYAVLRGHVVETDLVEFGGRGGDITFLAPDPHKIADRIPLASPRLMEDMYTLSFEQIRSLILTQSDFVVQDDSGVPLRLFARDAWKLQFHGRYEAPTPEFGKHLQKDLKVEMQRNSTGKLPFSYGYAYKQAESNLMTAERAQ